MAKSPNKAAAPAADKAKATEVKALAIVNPKALSVDVGPYVVKNWATANQDQAKAEELISAANRKKYDLSARMTMAIVKASKADKSIDLTATVKYGPEGTKAMSVLNDQIAQALGLKVVKVVTKGNTTTNKLEYAPEVASYFPRAGLDPESVEGKAAATLRSNLSHTLKKCAMAALAINERGITAKADAKSGTLLLSGPAIKKEFGADSVKLDEKQTVENTKKGGDPIKLKQRPSFTAIADLAAQDHGSALRRGSNTRGKGAAPGKSGSGTTLIDPLKALNELAQVVVKTCERFAKTPPTDEQRKPLEMMQNALAEVLD